MQPRRLAQCFIPAAALALACGSKSSTSAPPGSGSTTGGISAAAPLLAIASPVASRSASSTTTHLSRALSAVDQGAPSPDVSLPARIASIKARLAKTTVDDCLAGIQLDAPQAHVACYGPSLAFINHPDVSSAATMPASEAQMKSAWCSSTILDTGLEMNGCLPSGDLGIWQATEPGTNEACTAATMNAQVASAAGLVNSAVDLMAGLICVANVQGKELGAGGAAVDLADTLDQNQSMKQIQASFSTASVQRLADTSDGRSKYQITIVGTVGTTPISVAAVHSPGDDAAGLVSGYLKKHDPMMSVDYFQAFSVLYQLDGKDLRYELRSGNTKTDVSASELFDSDGTFDFAAQIARYRADMQAGQSDGMASGGVYDRGVIDGTTGLGTLIHAWQAGSGDSFTRVFHASTSADPAGGPDTGFGYFGFGPPLDSPNLGEIVGMFCNWAGPGANMHGWTSGVANVNTEKVQGQTMARDAAGIFVPTGDDHITYAPDNGCSSAAASGFVWQQFDQQSPTLSDLETLEATATDVSSHLIPYGDPSVGTMPTVTAPAPYAGAPAP